MDYDRHIYNATKLIAIVLAALAIIIGAVGLTAFFVWPIGLWLFFGQPLSLAVALVVVWIAAIL